MLTRAHRWGAFLFAGLMLAGLASAGHGNAEEPLAFVTEIKGEVSILRATGTTEAAKVGARLYAGDAVRSGAGEAALIYLSGRSTRVASGKEHQVQVAEGKPSALVARLRETLDEIDGPKDAKAGPVVHGMARALEGIANQRPANTWLSQPDFAFTWDETKGTQEYDFVLETSQGAAVLHKTVKGTRVPASSLPLERGRRYVWKVREHGAFLVGSTAGNWVEIVAEQEADSLHKTLKEVEKVYQGETRALLQAAVLYRGGFYYETQSLLETQQTKRELAPAEMSLLAQAKTKMAP